MHEAHTPSGVVAVLARTLRGLEHVAAAEIAERLGATAVRIGHREVAFTLDRLTPAVTCLGTLDDAFLVVHEGPAVAPRRSGLAAVRYAGEQIDVAAALAVLAPVRALDPSSFDVTASFLGRRTYSRFEIEDALGDSVERASGCRYLSRAAGGRAAGDLSLRVHLTPEATTVAVRIAERPLHRRPYRVATRPGALHPPLARALALLAAPRGGEVLLDPVCGTGTIPIEARHASGHRAVLGSDLDPAAIDSARANAAAAHADVRLAVADAAHLPLADGHVDAVAANPPWDRRVRPAGALALGLRPLFRELARVLRPGGRAALLAAPGLRVDAPLEVVDRFPVRVSGAVVDVVTLLRRGRA